MMPTSNSAPIIIIGNGISGITAARHIRKTSNRPMVVISEETPYFFSRTALMYVYMGHMKWEHTQPYENTFWKKNKISLVQGRVKEVHGAKQYIVMDDESVWHFSDLILATGSKPNFFGWEGQGLKAVQGLYHKNDLESIEYWSKDTQNAVVVGGGLIGVELAEMLISRGISVHFLVRESSFWNRVLPAEESEMINRHIRAHGVDLRLDTELEKLVGDDNGRVKAVVTKGGETIPCQWVGIAVGVSPNIDFLKNSDVEVERGIKVNAYLETNIPHVYAIGDCAEQQEPIGKRRPIEAVWYTGRIMGETVAKTITQERTAYNPGVWFNSAKFFDIEYQTYGWVSAQPEPLEEAYFFWQHPKKDLLVRFAYHPKTHLFLGVNTFGIRMRHEVFDRWLREEQTVDFVIQHLAEAHFDPEFYRTYHRHILEMYE